MINSELNNQQTDWLTQTEELNNTEASKVNGRGLLSNLHVLVALESQGAALESESTGGIQGSLANLAGALEK